ncbi:MAG TPA: AAA family ATPase [Orrella sp.]
MNPPILTFFNNESGVGKTSLVYHLAWMFASLNKRVVLADLDPQANLTAACIDEDHIDMVWNASTGGTTMYRCVEPLTAGGDLQEPVLQNLAANLYLLPGDIALSTFEATLSTEWVSSMGESSLYRPMHILTAFWQVMQMAAKQIQADIVLVDLGPNLGAINRSVLVATDYVVIPLGVDLFSLQGLKSLGPTLREWRNLWIKRLDNWNNSIDSQPYAGFQLPVGKMQPIGYLCQQQSVRLDRPVKADDKWVRQIPALYRDAVLGESVEPDFETSQASDPYCLGTLKHYRSLIALGQEHRKPIFDLTSADGAIGSHANAVVDARKDFKQLALKIGAQLGVQM